MQSASKPSPPGRREGGFYEWSNRGRYAPRDGVRKFSLANGTAAGCHCGRKSWSRVRHFYDVANWGAVKGEGWGSKRSSSHVRFAEAKPYLYPLAITVRVYISNMLNVKNVKATARRGI